MPEGDLQQCRSYSQTYTKPHTRNEQPCSSYVLALHANSYVHVSAYSHATEDDDDYEVDVAHTNLSPDLLALLGRSAAEISSAKQQIAGCDWRPPEASGLDNSDAIAVSIVPNASTEHLVPLVPRSRTASVVPGSGNSSAASSTAPSRQASAAALLPALVEAASTIAEGESTCVAFYMFCLALMHNF